MKIFITGGSGFIGEKFCRVLKFDDICYYNFDLKQKQDIRNYRQVSNCIKKFKPDVVIHLAAQAMLRNSFNDPISDAEVNILGSLNVFDACVKHNVKKVLYTSTGGARYGKYSKKVKESNLPRPVSPYGISKHNAEHYLDFFHNSYGLNYMTLSFGNVIGGSDPISNNRILTTIIHSIIDDTPIVIYGNGKQRRDFVHVDDIVKIMRRIVYSDYFLNELLNLSSGESYSILDIIKRVEFLTGKKAILEFKKANSYEVTGIKIDCSKASRDLRWAPMSLFEGIERTIEEIICLRKGEYYDSDIKYILQ